MNGDERHGLILRSAYYLGVVARVSADAIAFPYRQLRGSLVSAELRDEPQEQPPPRRRERLLPPRLPKRPARGERQPTRLGGHREEPAPERPRARPRRDLLPVAAARAAADEGFHTLAAALTDPNPEVRMAAVETLGDVGDLDPDKAGRMLADVLHDPDPLVRVTAADVAGRTRATTVVFSLILALDDSEPAVREAAAHALERITGKQIELHSDDLPEARQTLIDGLKRWWKRQRLDELTGR